MTGNQVITKESFEALLTWLDPDREAAALKYETIRSRLIKIFASRGFCDAEDLADLTINRVLARLPDIRDAYVGQPANYFYGVARKVLLETRRRKELATGTIAEIAPAAAVSGDAACECLRQCLKQLPVEQGELVLGYYLYQKRAKIDNRKQLAERFGLTANALRLRAHRVRIALEKCVLQCVNS